MGYKCMKRRYFLLWLNYIEECHMKKKIKEDKEKLWDRVHEWLEPL